MVFMMIKYKEKLHDFKWVESILTFSERYFIRIWLDFHDLIT